MSESNPPDFEPATFRRQLGAIHVPAGPRVPSVAAIRVGDFPIPREVDFTNRLDLTGDAMLGNDTYGDCVQAFLLRMAQAQCPYHRRVTTDEALALFRRLNNRPPDAYGTQTGPAFDTIAREGMDWADQDRWVPRHISVIREGDPIDMAEVKLSISAFRGVGLTINVPRDGFDPERGWFIPANPDDIEGQHQIGAFGFTESGPLWTYTWGQIAPMPLDFFFRYLIAADAFPSRWLTPERLAANGMSWDRLMQISAAVAG